MPGVDRSSTDSYASKLQVSTLSMREPTPIFDEGDLRDIEARAAEAATDIGTDDYDLSPPVWEVIRTLLLAIVVVGTTALIATLI